MNAEKLATKASLLADTIDQILEWSEEHPEFDTTFVSSLQEQLLSRGDLSGKQVQALHNIVEKYDI